MKKFRLLAAVLSMAMVVTAFASCGGDTEAASSATSSANNGTSSTVSLPSINISSDAGVSLPEPVATITLVEKGAEFQCKTLTTEEFNTFIADNPTWKDADFDVSEWQTANAPLGDRLGSSPIGWGGEDQEPHGLLCVTTFNVEDLEALADTEFYMSIFFDNTINIYLNGTLVYSNMTADTGANDWVDNYTDIDFTESINQYLVEGENTLAISLLDGWGGRELDLAILSR